MSNEERDDEKAQGEGASHACQPSSRLENPRQPPRPEPVVVTRAYDVARWLHERSARFPKEYRFGLADRMQQESLALLVALVDASYRRDRKVVLENANLALARLRVLVRLARDLGCLSTKQYLFAIEPLDEVGKMIGGWSRYDSARNRESVS